MFTPTLDGSGRSAGICANLMVFDAPQANIAALEPCKGVVFVYL
jgi:hypothetical protein